MEQVIEESLQAARSSCPASRVDNAESEAEDALGRVLQAIPETDIDSPPPGEGAGGAPRGKLTRIISRMFGRDKPAAIVDNAVADADGNSNDVTPPHPGPEHAAEGSDAGSASPRSPESIEAPGAYDVVNQPPATHASAAPTATASGNDTGTPGTA